MLKASLSFCDYSSCDSEYSDVYNQPEQAPSWLRLKLRNTMMMMRKICNHPYLIEYPFIEHTDLLRIDEGEIQLSDMMSTQSRSDIPPDTLC